MKKYYLNLFICALLLSLCSIEGAWAKGEVTFYAKLKTQVASSCSNMGKVYAGTSNSAGTYNASSSTSGELNSGQKESGTTSADVGPFYAFAQENDNYVFEGWKETDDANADWYSRDKTCQITVTSTAQSSGGYTKTLYAFFSVKKKVTVTMPSTENGSYTYSCTDGNGTVNTTTAKEITTDAAITLTATPVSGYKFFGWYTLNGTTESFLNYSATYTTTFTSNTTLYAKFIPSSTAVFTLRGTAQYFYDLNTANSAAVASSNKIIVPTANGTIPAGNYTISGGVTLLIPFDDANTLYTTEPTWPKQAPSGQSAYRKLTLKSGVNIVVNGAISVSAQSQGNQPYGGCVYGKYGQIDMESGSTITINSSANLYCWGYITGGGAITAKSGAKVYEDFQLTCWRGGTAASTMNSNASSKGVFPLAQYYIQNIEAPLTLEAGALEYTCTAVTALSSVWDATVQIVGTNSGLFHISSGSITKWYDAAKDRQMYSINGNTKLGAVVVDVSVTISSEKFVLPVTNNMDITVASGTLTCDQRVALLPGARIVIDEGATVKFDSGSKLFIYDKDEWKGSYNGSMVSYNYPGNATHLPAPYSPTCSSIKTLRTFDKMDDAELDVNGTLEMTGALYTTIHGANVRSSNGTGIIKYKTSAGTESVTYQAFQGGSGGTEITWQNISITSAKLHNSAAFKTTYGADFEYLATAGTAANTTINYKNGHWGWMEIWKDEEGTILKAINTTTQQSGTAPSDPSQPCKTFVGWSTETFTANQEVIHTATYTANTFDITYSAGANGSGTVAGGTKDCGVDFTLSTSKFTRAGYVQTGWSTSDGDAKAYDLGGSYTEDADITLYPFWTPAVANVTINDVTTPYLSIKDAFDAANEADNAIVTMLQGASVTSEISITKTMTIDLNGQTVSSTQAAATGVFNINASGKTITIKDSDTGGKIDHTASYSGKLYGINFTAGSLDIIGGTIYAKNTTTANNTNYRAYGIYTSSASAITMSGGAIEAHTPNNPSAFGIYAGNACEFTMTDGTISATGTSSVRGVYLQGTTTLSNNAKITASATGENCYTIFAKAGTMTIENGTYTAEGTGAAYVIFFEAGKVTVNGGKFNGSTCELTKRNTAYNVILQGGVYVHETDLTAKCATNFYKFDLTEEEKDEVGSVYNYKVSTTYTVTFEANGHGTAPAAQVIEKGKRATEPTAPTATGYTFDGWYKEAGCTTPWNFTSDVVTAATPLYAKWIPRNDTHYTVKHYKQKLDDSYATTPDDIDDLQGTTDASVTPERKNYAGFTAPAGQTVTILADGSRVVEYKYTRNSPNLSWSSNGGNALTGSYTTGSVKYGASITAPNDPTRTGYSFSGWSPAFTGTMPATDTEYKAQWTPEKRKVTWKDGTTTIKTEDLDYDSKPSYAYVKTPTAQYSFPLLKWEDEDTHVQYDPDNLPVVKNNVTYVAICDNVVNKYTVRFVNDQGTELQVISNIPYGDWPEYTGETPSSEIINDYYIREFKGWNPEIAEVADNTTYTARYEIVAKLDIKEEYVVPTTTIVETTTVEVGGSLNVANEKKLTTTDLIIEGSADEDWEEITSGEVVAVESAIEADNAYYDMRPEGGYKARIWYAVAVPWTVDVPTGVPGHVYDANGHALRLNIDFDLLYYDGAQRAAGGTNNWRYVAQEEAENQVMKPGKAYMIYLASPTSKLRFEKSTGNWLTKELPLEHYAETTGNDGKDANWNGIANPAIYRAYLNAGTDGNWGQVFVPGSAPRDGGTYAPVDMSTYKLAVGQPIFVQAENTEKETVIAYRSNDDYLSHAPRRAQADAAEQEARYAVEIAVNGKRGDRIFIATNDDKEDAYTIGSDVVKMGWSSTKPQMWINRYGSKLCVNTVEFNGSSATYPLMIQIPSEGEYSIYTPSEILSGHELYITYNGRAIWNLSYAPFEGTFAAGTHAEYGLKLVRSKLPTDIEQTNAGQEDVRKVLIDDHVYIIRGGAVFSIDGQLVK